MWRHYVYVHRRADSGEPFYVGKGSIHKKEPYRRANVSTKRNNWWRRIADKHGVAVEIVAHFVTDADAQTHEKTLIAEIGRADLGKGPLVNLTDGGDGHCGLIIPERVLKIRSDLASRPRTEAWVTSIRRARKNGGNGGVVKRGDKLPKSWVASIAAAKVGAKNPYFGKPTAVSKKVMNTVTGIVYDSISRAAKAEGMGAGKLYSIFDGHTKVNTTALVRV